MASENGGGPLEGASARADCVDPLHDFSITRKKLRLTARERMSPRQVSNLLTICPNNLSDIYDGNIVLMIIRLTRVRMMG